MNSGPLRLGGVPEHFNLPWHMAMESGALADIDLTWEDQYGGTGEMLTKLEAGKLDVVSILTEGTVRAIAHGLAATVIQVYVRSPLQWGVFVPARSDVTVESELGGARIAISRFGSGSHLMAYIHAERMGWTIDPDQFVEVKNLDGAVTAFNDGTAGLFLWDRYMTSPLVEAGTFRRLGVQPTPWPSFVIAARNDMVGGRTTELGRVVDAVIAQAQVLMADPDGPLIVSQRYGIAFDQATAWMATTEFASRGPMEPDVGAKVLATLERAGLD